MKRLKKLTFSKYVESTILCVRFPFLYPRNRFTGLHYSNYQLSQKIRDIYSRSTVMKKDPYSTEIVDKKLYFKYKLLKWYEQNLLQWIHFPTKSTELDSMDFGWRKRFGIDMCREIRSELLKSGGMKRLYSYRITQIKEKWGELEWYDNGGTEGTDLIIGKYQRLSRRTCIDCGAPADYITIGYILPYCHDCLPNGAEYEDIADHYRYTVPSDK